MLLCRAPGRSLSRVRSLDDRGGERGGDKWSSLVPPPRTDIASASSLLLHCFRTPARWPGSSSLPAGRRIGAPPPGAAGGKARVDRIGLRTGRRAACRGTPPWAAMCASRDVTVTTRPASGGFGCRDGGEARMASGRGGGGKTTGEQLIMARLRRIHSALVWAFARSSARSMPACPPPPVLMDAALQCPAAFMFRVRLRAGKDRRRSIADRRTDRSHRTV